MKNHIYDYPATLTRETVNPYRTALGLIYHRLKWDLNPHSWLSRSKLRGWKNRYLGRKAVILCNGPTLLKVDFSQLGGAFTFGLNKIDLLFDKQDFRPSCIVAVNPLVMEQNESFYNHTDIPLFLDYRASTRNLVRMRPNVAYLQSGPPGFARDCSFNIGNAPTVTYVAMQLAFHMGFSDVALVGCDHRFTDKGPPNMTVVAGAKDENHFDSSYFSGGMKWQLPDLFESEVAYTRAKNVYESCGRRLVNATEGGHLQVFDRVSLDEFVGI